MLLLGIDTAGTTSVAVATVADDGGLTVAAEITTTSTTDHVEQLTPSIHQVLAAAGVSGQELDGVVVGVGPGPFTGLRVGMVAAQTYGFAWGKPLHGVMSLDAVAIPAAQSMPAGTEFVVATDARRREIYYGHYRTTEKHPQLLTGPDVLKASELDPAVRALPAFGPGVQLYAEAFAQLEEQPTPATPPAHGPAAYLIERAGRALLAGETLLPVVPLYLRESDAKIPAQNWARNVR